LKTLVELLCKYSTFCYAINQS